MLNIKRKKDFQFFLTAIENQEIPANNAGTTCLIIYVGFGFIKFKSNIRSEKFKF